MSKTDGAGQVADAVIAAASQAVDPEQLNLLPPTRFLPGSRAHQDLERAVRRDGPGRPVGARNRTTRETLDFVRKVLGDPVLERARWLRHTPETLARELSCSKAEAFDRLDRIRADLTRLFYPALAPVDGQGNTALPHFTMVIGAGQAAAVGQKPWDYIDYGNTENTQENQSLPSQDGPQSHGGQSHDKDKPL